MSNHYTVTATTTTLVAGDKGFAPEVARQDFETKYDALKWAWLVIKRKKDTLDLKQDLSEVEFIQITSLDDDNDYYFDATPDTDDLVFIAALAAERPQAPIALTDEA